MQALIKYNQEKKSKKEIKKEIKKRGCAYLGAASCGLLCVMRKNGMS